MPSTFCPIGRKSRGRKSCRHDPAGGEKSFEKIEKRA